MSSNTSYPTGLETYRQDWEGSVAWLMQEPRTYPADGTWSWPFVEGHSITVWTRNGYIVEATFWNYGDEMDEVYHWKADVV